MKRKIFVSALLVIALLIACGGTYAYFTTEDTATNVITAGNLRVELKESALTEDGQSVPFEDVFGVMPGSSVSKIVQVENTGDHAAYIRVRVEKTIMLAEGVEGEADLDLIELDINTENWTEKDGWYYYNEPLEAGQTTEPLFTKASFAPSMDNLYQGSAAQITVHMSAVQVANNGTSVMEAAGWSE